MDSVEKCGLVVFIIVVLLNVGGLLLDLALSHLGLTTVSHLVRTGYWGIGLVIVGLQVVGIAGLMFHFWGSYTGVTR